MRFCFQNLIECYLVAVGYLVFKEEYFEIAIHKPQVAEHLFCYCGEIFVLVYYKSCLFLMHEEKPHDVSEVRKQTVEEIWCYFVRFEAFYVENVRGFCFDNLLEAFQLVSGIVRRVVSCFSTVRVAIIVVVLIVGGRVLFLFIRFLLRPTLMVTCSHRGELRSLEFRFAVVISNNSTLGISKFGGILFVLVWLHSGLATIISILSLEILIIGLSFVVFEMPVILLLIPAVVIYVVPLVLLVLVRMTALVCKVVMIIGLGVVVMVVHVHRVVWIVVVMLVCVNLGVEILLFWNRLDYHSPLMTIAVVFGPFNHVVLNLQFALGFVHHR